MTPIENGMLVGAASEWERIHAPTPWDYCTEEDLVSFACEEDLTPSALGHYLGTGIRDESAAATVFDELPQWLQASMVRDYIVARDLEPDFNAWKGGHPCDW